jgi:hypothetical protein
MTTKKSAIMVSFLATVGLFASQAHAGTAVAPGSGHPYFNGSADPWSTSNPSATNAVVSDNMVCGQFPGSAVTWVTPLAVPTSTSNRTTTITQTLTGILATSQAWSFNPNGTAFSGIAQSSSTVIGNLVVPVNGTAMVKSFLSPDVDNPTACADTFIFT